MFARSTFGPAVLCPLAGVVLAAYYSLVFYPGHVNVLAAFLAVLAISASMMMLGEENPLIQLYVGTMMMVLLLSSLCLSFDQPAFTTDFLLFYLLHFVFLGLAIFIGETLQNEPVSGGLSRPRLVPHLAVLLYVSIGIYVALTKGVRIESFLAGQKVGGDVFKIAGFSGVQGLMLIFSLCTFSLLSRPGRIVFLIAVCVFAVLDVKRGEFIRLAVYLTFLYVITNQSNFWRGRAVWVFVGSVIFAAVALVLAGEMRQHAYDQSFSISSLLNSRLPNKPLDWLYGYVGINASVLQVTLDSGKEPLGWLPMLLRFVLGSESFDPGAVPSIHGFNAGTVFTGFASWSLLSQLDFLCFCVFLIVLIASARNVAILSIKAFWLTQLFAFCFGNQFILPYYSVGYLLAVAYLHAARFQIGLSRGTREPA